MQKTRILIVAAVLVWVGFVFSAFYIVQKPLAIQVGGGLLSILRTLAITAALLLEAGVFGGRALRKFTPQLDAGERIFLGTGLGLGAFGLAGFGLVTFHFGHAFVFLFILAGLFILAITGGRFRSFREDLLELWKGLRERAGNSPGWVPWAAGIAVLLSFLLAFAPPAEAFDALLYHLAIPAAWLKDGGLAFSQIIPHYWFPALVEGTFVWGQALGSETTAALLHLSWGTLTAGLIWWWAKKGWTQALAWRSTAVLLSMPSLALLGAWAYTDLALAFYSLATLYIIWATQRTGNKGGWALAGIFAGLAMGVKYTSFLLPLICLGWLVMTEWRRGREVLMKGVQFAGPAILTASPWYIRNWIWTGNPFYPFIFGGKGWDSFLAAHYSQAGTGIGFSLSRLLLLPVDITLGQYDANFFDGRIGPLWLILLPGIVWLLWRVRKQGERAALYLPTLFGLASLGVWTIGIINTSALWQSRLLFPALLPLTVVAALAWEAFFKLDTPRFRFSFIFNTLAIGCIALNLLDLGLFVLRRNPLATAVGITSRQAYFELTQPNYADALELVNQTPPGSKVYFVFEPRSYGMTRAVTPDAINTNLGHDLWLFHTPEAVLEAWKTEGYGYVLYQRAGDSLVEDRAEAERLFAQLSVAGETKNTILYQIPSP